MTTTQAVDIVLQLAEGNIIDEREDADMSERQSEAVAIVQSNYGKTPALTQARANNLTIDDLLDEITVHMGDGDKFPESWFAVETQDGVTAYFMREVDAFSFRLSLINRLLNP